MTTVSKVTFNFSGTSGPITQGTNSIPDGTPFSGTFSYYYPQSGTTTFVSGGTRSIYKFASLDITVLGQTVTEVPGELNVYNDIQTTGGVAVPGDTLNTFDPTIGANLSSGSINGVTLKDIFLILLDTTGTAFSSSILPNDLAFSAFNEPFIGFDWDVGGTNWSTSWRITAGTATVTAISLSGQMALTAATEHVAFANSTSVATFSDSNSSDQAGDFTASIDWGDGQTTSGIVSGGNGFFTVSGGHTYADEGNEQVSVTLTHTADQLQSTVSGSVAVVANTGPSFDLNGDTISDLVFQNNGQPGIWLWNGTAPTAEVGLTNPGASWHIITSRDVNGDDNADLIWQNDNGQPGVWLMNGTTPIGEVGLANPGPSWHIVASGDTNGDGKSDLIWQNTDDGTLGIWLMNGATPTFEASLGNPGANWKVVGAADFNGDGNDDILLQNTATGNLMIDLLNGTSIVSAVSITVGDPSWHAVSTGAFNGQVEIAWQNNNGTPGIWLMNGTTPAAAVGLSNPGAGWQLISVDHFAPNGQVDLLFQNNTSGAMQLWEMNGTSLAAQVNLPNPGAGWQSVNGHPFAAG